MEPSLGRIVLFKFLRTQEDGSRLVDTVPAIVTGVHPQRVVDLTIFHPVESTQLGQSTFSRMGVEYAETEWATEQHKDEGFWSWPPRG